MKEFAPSHAIQQQGLAKSLLNPSMLSDDVIDHLRDQFGDGAGWYFLFVRHLCAWLLPLSLLGIIIQVYVRMGRDGWPRPIEQRQNSAASATARHFSAEPHKVRIALQESQIQSERPADHIDEERIALRRQRRR